MRERSATHLDAPAWLTLPIVFLSTGTPPRALAHSQPLTPVGGKRPALRDMLAEAHTGGTMDGVSRTGHDDDATLSKMADKLSSVTFK